LPLSLKGLSIEDEIGNVTTVQAAKTEENISIRLVPRFSLFGGWKSFWKISFT